MARPGYLKIRLSFSTLRWGLACLVFLALAAELATETFVLSTYYPAPSGVYNRMITTGETYLARDGGAVAVGTVADLGSGTAMSVMGGSVGIGTTAPAALLDVHGKASIGTTAPTVNLAVNGGFRVGILSGDPQTSASVVGEIYYSLASHCFRGYMGDPPEWKDISCGPAVTTLTYTQSPPCGSDCSIVPGPCPSGTVPRNAQLVSRELGSVCYVSGHYTPNWVTCTISYECVR